jgi:chromosomal replication initiation ATPase DnaA
VSTLKNIRRVMGGRPASGWSRQVAVYLARELAGRRFIAGRLLRMPWSDIAREFGYAHRSGAHRAAKVVADKMRSDPKVRAEIENLKRQATTDKR